MITALLILLLCASGALLRTIVVVYRKHITDLKDRNAFLYDHITQLRNRITELERQCQ